MSIELISQIGGVNSVNPYNSYLHNRFFNVITTNKTIVKKATTNAWIAGILFLSFICQAISSFARIGIFIDKDIEDITDQDINFIKFGSIVSTMIGSVLSFILFLSILRIESTRSDRFLFYLLFILVIGFTIISGLEIKNTITLKKTDIDDALKLKFIYIPLASTIFISFVMAMIFLAPVDMRTSFEKQLATGDKGTGNLLNILSILYPNVNWDKIILENGDINPIVLKDMSGNPTSASSM